MRELLRLVVQPDVFPAAPTPVVPGLLLPAPRPHRCTRCGAGTPPVHGFYYAGDADHELCLACLKVLGLRADLPEPWPPLAGSVPRPPTEAEIEEPRLGLCPETVADLQAALSIAQGRIATLLALLQADEAGQAEDLADTLRCDLDQALHDFRRHDQTVCAVCGWEEFHDFETFIEKGGPDADDIFVDGGLVPLHVRCIGGRTDDGLLCGQCDSCGGFAIGLEVLPGTQYAQCQECADVAVPHPRELAAVAGEEVAA